ncbi:MAG: 3-phosphoshikimate 1-carboxyvinyltransferase [candidate division WOR-3 bacterium]|nr:3-phosphoshikimate 1-carboxyvinyltransferase [candidate division WOR-3 bacterium]
MNLRVKKCSIASGEIVVGGDKSITHRSLILGAIARGRTEILDYSRAEDCLSTLRCLKKLGAEIEIEKKKIVINGKGLRSLHEPDDVLDCGNSGTTMRLLAGLLAGQKFYSVLSGDDSLRKRPMERVIKPLKLMGARIESRQGGFAPLAIRGNRLEGIEYRLPVASAQVKSSLMLAGLYADSETIIEEPVPTRDHTERLFKFFGIKFIKKKNRIRVIPGQEFKGIRINIPNDISSAAFFVVLGCLIAKKLILRNIGINPLRTGMIEVLKDSGALIEIKNQKVYAGEPVGDVFVKKHKPSPFVIGAPLIPTLIDEIPVLAVLATQLEGTSIIKDAAELRVKETDRLKAIAGELKKFGANIKELADGLMINGPSRLKGTVCESYNDHRIAMALTIAGLIADGETVIKNAQCIKISFPDFIDKLKTICGEDYVRIEDAHITPGL